MREFQKDSESFSTSPFQKEILLENYFAAANRSEVLAQMKEAVQGEVSLMILTGEEGSGKTMLCRVFEHEASPSCKPVFFSRTVDSFEEVVRIIAMQLGLDAAIAMDARNIDQALEQITDFLLRESVALLLIFDEAENIYLATLERIRKMLDLIIGSGARMHILFSGRETFLENCDQLSLCNFQNADELHFDLIPLTEAETAVYLSNCAARIPGLNVTAVFSDEVVKNIYSLAKGNFGTTNILGEESLKSQGADTSFMVLLDRVKEDAVIRGKHIRTTKLPNLMGRYKAYVPWSAGVVCFFLLFLFLFGSEEEESDIGLNVEQIEEVETVTEVPETNIQFSEKIETVAPVQHLEEEKTTAVQMMEGDTSSEAMMVEEPGEEISQQEPNLMPGMAEQITAETIEPTEPVEIDEASGIVEEAAEEVAVEVKKIKEIQAPQQASEGTMEEIALLQPNQNLKIKLDRVVELQRRIIKVRPRAEVRKKVAPNVPRTVDQLYDERFLAGFGWEAKAKKDMYTVQLMALASKTAEKNLKKMLAQDKYRQEAGNFYILKTGTAPGNIFVFYGEYPSIERARLVQNSLPKFLRDHNPYALSIKGAIAKVGK